jgi:hypothetical protein
VMQLNDRKYSAIEISINLITAKIMLYYLKEQF